MAIDPKAKVMSVTYDGGRATATLGLLEELFGSQTLTWTAPTAGSFVREPHQRERVIGEGSKPVKGSTVQKKGYVGRLASNNASGNPATVYFSDGTSWEVRYAGPFAKLVKAITSGAAKDKIVQIVSERGAQAFKGIALPKPA